ncbi:pleiotropic regulatory protein RsmS [Vibrio aquimaris]|uniref:Primosomal protein n=1 Tax=Vibrio aquimaris TaxID=2587862 RepID=A0A5P9CIW2_9VIBR|nr:pleiotropic regulatory protein RsmS [Vibrio aquimaris]QFT25961.1 hypothetical protein FIV01_05935 [Vibrio aquimaris]
MSSPDLEQAPDEIKLAVDLIYLIESHNIDPKVAFEAIKIVTSDIERKLEDNQ